MTFLAPWALAFGAMGALATVLLHLVSSQRPAAWNFPTTRFIPDQRTLVSRAATRPRDLLLLALRVLLLLAAAAAFARPVLAPSGDAVARVVLLDRSLAVGDPTEALSRARALADVGDPFVVIAFDTLATTLREPRWDSLSRSTGSVRTGSLSSALVAARRASVALAERADSVHLILVSPLAASAVDSATRVIRSGWPGAIQWERVAPPVAPSESWRLERALSAEDPLGPAMASVRAGPAPRVTRLLRSAVGSADSAVARAGGTVVYWDSAAARRAAPQGLAAGDDVIVAALERTSIPSRDGRIVARWADGAAAATEFAVGGGCVRHVGIALPAAGDLALHPPFQRIARGLLAPCGLVVGEMAADSTVAALIVGKSSMAARSSDLRNTGSRMTPLSRWLFGLALVLAFVELAVRAKAPARVAT